MLTSGEIESVGFPRVNYNTIFDSLVSTYILINGEDWNTIMYQYVRATKKTLGRGAWIPQAYCSIGMLLGNLTLLALFTGILMEAFADDDVSDSEKKEIADFKAFW